MGSDGERAPHNSTLDRASLRDALAQLRLKLLDLTGRNRLLNFKHTAGRSLQFVEGSVPAVYERLVEGNNRPTISIQGLPEPPRSEWVDRNGRLARPDPRDWAQRNGIPTGYDLTEGPVASSSNVRALFYQDELAKHCRKLEREATLAIEETGSNMLFLVLGFLEYPDQRESDRRFNAPIISIPVNISRRDVGGKQIFSIQYTGEDIADNISLREKLRNDFGISIPGLFDEDRLSDDVVDVASYLDDLRKVIKDQPGFTVRNRLSLALLSFTNMLLVRDLDPKKWPQSGEMNTLIDHPIVQKVFGTSADDGGYGDAVDHPVEDGPGTKVQLVFDADSSQHSALVDALFEKKNLVIEGPPGTGKSQTISNLIAASIAEGKRVLFIAEKLAALDVVRTRLSKAGLSPFLLELHSNKTNKKKVLEDLKNRLECRTQVPSDLVLKLEKLDGLRRELREYAQIVNSVVHNRLGLTVHELMWRAERHRAAITVGEASLYSVQVPEAGDLSLYELERRVGALRHLGAQFDVIGGFGSDSTFWGFEPESIVPGDENELARLFASSIEWAQALAEDAREYARLIGGAGVGCNLAQARDELTAVRDLKDKCDSRPYLHSLAGLLASDGTGKKARRLLGELSGQIGRFEALTPVVAAGVNAESEVTAQRVEGLRDLGQAASDVGADLGSASDLAGQLGRLRAALSALDEATCAIKTFCEQRQIAFSGSLNEFSRLAELSGIVAEVPEAALLVQRPELAREGAVHEIARLKDAQDQWHALRNRLAESLYLDIPPSEQTLDSAILALRQGDAWYRIFDSEWRAAIKLHKNLSREPRKLASSARLAELGKLRDLKQLRVRLESDRAWLSYLGIPAPQDFTPLDDHLAVARWNQEMVAALEEVGVHDLSVIDLTPEKARVLRREYAALTTAISIATSSLDVLHAVLPGLTNARARLGLNGVLSTAGEFAEVIEGQLPWLQAQCPSQRSFHECLAACEAALERSKITMHLATNGEYLEVFGDAYRGIDTDIGGLDAVLDFAHEVMESTLGQSAKRLITTSDPVRALAALETRLGMIVTGLEQAESLTAKISMYGKFDLEAWAGTAPESDIERFGTGLTAKLEGAASSIEDLTAWASYVARRNEVGALGLGAFRARLESGQAASGELGDVYAYCVYAALVREVFRHVPELGKFSGLKHNQVRDEFKRVDRDTIQLRGAAIAGQLSSRIRVPAGRNGPRVDDKTEMVLLNYLLPQQRPRMPVRKMMARAAASIQALKPCFMMSPQAVAQFLEPGRVKFDLVIMDEASQLKPEQAIGAIARGAQLVVVGDPKQLPPTSFFTRGGQTGDEEEEYTTDAESILEVCAGQFRPSRSLKWHYRSQHHSLIAFSNANYYKNLIIFPSPYGQSASLGIRATYLADAVYDNQTNLKEARRVVDAVVEHIQGRPKDSLGVVTLNIKQRDLIAELVDDRLRTLSGAEDFIQYWRDKEQPFFVRNLETVQGDERDAIIISTTFGRPPGSNSVRQNFGPISRLGGWRRLNVLFTRARKSVAVYTSLRPEDIVVDATTPEGTKSLRAYLEYARSGQLATVQETALPPDSDFEVAVMQALQMRGYEVTPQLGVAGYRIDIAVKHPEVPGTYLAAIECDGASYHSAQSVRDRDRIRQEILESVGWRGRIWRIWSTDWFRTPRQEMEKLLGFLDHLRKTWTPEHASGASWVEEGVASAVASPPSDASSPAEVERRIVSEMLLDSGDELEVELGDVVRYADINNPADVLTVRIVRGATDLANGLVSISAPLAQTLLSAVVGDEVSLHVPGMPARQFKIIDIKKPN